MMTEKYATIVQEFLNPKYLKEMNPETVIGVKKLAIFRELVELENKNGRTRTKYINKEVSRILQRAQGKREMSGDVTMTIGELRRLFPNYEDMGIGSFIEK